MRRRRKAGAGVTVVTTEAAGLSDVSSLDGAGFANCNREATSLGDTRECTARAEVGRDVKLCDAAEGSFVTGRGVSAGVAIVAAEVLA